MSIELESKEQNKISWREKYDVKAIKSEHEMCDTTISEVTWEEIVKVLGW